MGLETATWIEDLDATNPTPTDPKSQGDDHLRMIKGVLQNQFTSLGQNAVTSSAEDLNGGLFNKRLAGYADTGAHEIYAADVNDLFANSTWRVGTGTTNLPSDFALTSFGFLTTFQSDSIRVAQVLYGRGGSNAYKIWMRHNNAGTWNAWKLVVNGEAAFWGGIAGGTGNLLYGNGGTTNTASRTGLGVYTLVFTTPAVDANYNVQLTINQNAASFIFVDNKTTSGFTVKTFNSAGSAADRTFDFQFSR